MLYLQLVEKLKNAQLISAIIKESIFLLHKLLLSEIEISQTEKNIIKNLAFFIGLITLSRNKSIPAKYFNVKGLIISNYPHRVEVAITIIF